MYGSPAAAYRVPKGSLSPVPVPMSEPTARSKSLGMVGAASFSTHEPSATRAALPCVQAVCIWMCVMPSEPGMKYFLAASSS